MWHAYTNAKQKQNEQAARCAGVERVFSCLASFSSPEPTILLACGWDRELWPDPIFWACAEYSFRILNQSDLLDLTRSPLIADFRFWTKPELSIPTAGQKDRGLWGREWKNSFAMAVRMRMVLARVCHLVFLYCLNSLSRRPSCGSSRSLFVRRSRTVQRYAQALGFLDFTPILRAPIYSIRAVDA